MATGDSTRPGPGAGSGDEPVTVAELFDDDTGRWQITTQTSIYVLDLDQRSTIRFPGAAGDQGIDPQVRAAYPVSVLEDDRQPRPIWLLVQCRVGDPMYLYTDVDPTSVTLRGTTPVREIRRLTAYGGHR
jgi:hypothetical protein